jgi:hypothetical protein
MIAQHDLQHKVRKAHEAQLHVADNLVPVNSAAPLPLGTECGIGREHDCFGRNHTTIEGRFITLWAYLQFPEDCARKDRRNIKRFRKAKALFGMGNGPSPLKYEVKPEDIQVDFVIIAWLSLDDGFWAEEPLSWQVKK